MNGVFKARKMMRIICKESLLKIEVKRQDEVPKIEKNKAVYTTVSVVYRWPGALKAFWHKIQVGPTNREKDQLANRRTDQWTDRQSDI